MSNVIRKMLFSDIVKFLVLGGNSNFLICHQIECLVSICNYYVQYTIKIDQKRKLIHYYTTVYVAGVLLQYEIK